MDNASSDFTNNKLNQTYASGTLDGHDADPITSDEFADMRAVDYGPWMPGGRGGLRNTLAYTNGMLCCSKKEWAEMNLISETNTQLVGRKLSISDKAKKNMNAAKDSAGANWVENGGVSYENAKVIKHRQEQDRKLAEKGDTDAAKRFNNRGGETIEKEANKKLKTATNTTKTVKDNNKKLGLGNTTTFKNNNGTNSSITYF